MKPGIYETERYKRAVSPSYNNILDKKTGSFARWGATQGEDPQWSPMGPEILDIEITVDGCPNTCAFCYKGNSQAEATNMTLGTFESILAKFGPNLGQIAFGITGVQTNPDFIPIMEHCRERGVVPNFTLSGADLTPEIAEKCSELVGAVAVSVYKPVDVGYDTVKTFTNLGVTQTNIHLMVSQETMPHVWRVVRDRGSDPRLADMNAIVFLTTKPKGRARGRFTAPTLAQYSELVKYCLDHDIAFGFDSCGASKFEAAIDTMGLSDAVRARLKMCSESCESDLFSGYVNVRGEFWHCSFSEGEPGIEPVNLLEMEGDFWMSEPVVAFREKLLATTKDGCRQCPIFPEINA